jgi:integrase
MYLVKPGERVKWRDGKLYPNRAYLVRGRRPNGREFEKTTGTRDPFLAQQRMGEIAEKLRDRHVPGPGERVSYTMTTEAYLAWKQPGEAVKVKFRRLAKAIDPNGDKHVGDVILANLVDAATMLFPTQKNETRNRWGIKPGLSVLHYAAKNRWRDWLRGEKLPEGPIVSRAASYATAKALMAAIDAEIAAVPARRLRLQYRQPGRDRVAIENQKQRWRLRLLLMVWLFKHGHRITDLLRVEWPNIDLPNRRYRLLVGKRSRVREKPMDAEVFELLANEPGPRTGRVFPWRNRSSVYDWLRPLCARLGVKFTPHMARHYLGTELNLMGKGQQTIAGVLDHADIASSARYQDADFDIQRAATAHVRRMRP